MPPPSARTPCTATAARYAPPCPLASAPRDGSHTAACGGLDANGHMPGARSSGLLRPGGIRRRSSFAQPVDAGTHRLIGVVCSCDVEHVKVPPASACQRPFDYCVNVRLLGCLAHVIAGRFVGCEK